MFVNKYESSSVLKSYVVPTGKYYRQFDNLQWQAFQEEWADPYKHRCEEINCRCPVPSQHFNSYLKSIGQQAAGIAQSIQGVDYKKDD